MTTQENNLANALFTTRNILRRFLKAGISEPTQLYKAAKRVGKEYKLDFNQTVIVFEEALKIA